MESKGRLHQHPLLVFLGSMNLAITLLVMLAIASVIGTVLKQNEAYASYVIKFGSFWFEVFRVLELYDVYSAIWFLVVLAFLLVSISACVFRHGPHFVRDMQSYQEHQHSSQLKKYTLSSHWHSSASREQALALTQQGLTQLGFKSKTSHTEQGTLIAAKKGTAHRIGYFFTHIAIVIICLGGLLDSNLKFKVMEWMGQVEAETRTIALTDVNPKANIAADNMAFRGSVNIPEGKIADVVFLTFKDGYLVQKLPFNIQVVDFRVEHYDTGMPKSFESDVVLTAPDLAEPIKTTLSVNKPLIYRDYAIYQSSFGDGGSQISLRAWPLIAANSKPSTLQGEVHKTLPLGTPAGDFKLELSDYKTNNVIPLPDDDPSGRKVKNLGPSLQYKVRDSAGQAVEYETYLAPIDREGRWYQVSKFRYSLAEPFEFLMLPLDKNQSLDRFMALLALINNPNGLEQVLGAMIAQEKDPKAREQLHTQQRFMQQLVNLFRARGFDGIRGFIDQAVEADKREPMMQQYVEILTVALQGLYLKVLENEGHPGNSDLSEQDRRFFADAIAAIDTLPSYGPPMFFEITGVEHRESSGLQITKSPGKNVVYFGSLLLTIGVFLLFYVRPQRLWLLAKDEDQGSELILAGKDAKDDALLRETFTQLSEQLQQHLPARPAAEQEA